jgi:hypothetical protein
MKMAIRGDGVRRFGLFHSLRIATVAAAALACSLATSPARAANHFLDDFEDGSVTDGNPVSWIWLNDVYSGYFPGTRVVQNGDYILTPNPSNSNLEDAVVSNVMGVAFTDVSVRVLARVEGPGHLVVGSRASDNYLAGYLASVNGEGNITIQRANPDNPAAPFVLETTFPETGSQTIYPERAADTDVWLQFDAIGSELSLTVWRPGDPQPAPQLFHVDNEPAANFSGTVALLVAEDGAVTTRGVFHQFEAIEVISGDTNRDTLVTRADLAHVSQFFGKTTGVILYADGDFTHDGVVSLADLALTQSNFTSPAPPQSPLPSAVAVPEPASCTLALLGGIGLFARRLRGHR